MNTGTSSSEFFEAKYRRATDPWNFAGSPYELRRYGAIVDALAGRRYRRGFEPGCSVGVLTERLAAICDAVEAIDFSATAVERARERCAHLPHVEAVCRSLPERMPVEGFDLLVCSEIGYYFGPEEWRELSEGLIVGMPAGATLLAAHWLGTSADHRMGGDEVHEIIGRSSSLRLEHTERHEEFRLDRWVRA